MKTNEQWEENFDKEFNLLYSNGMGSDMRLIKSFISSLLTSEREKVVLKGERNRIIMQIREEERERMVGEVEKLNANYIEFPIPARAGYNQAIKDVISLLSPKPDSK